MIENRFSTDIIAEPTRLAPMSNAFLYVSIPTSEPTQASVLVNVYQQLYQRAVQAHQRPTLPDLFAIMN